MTRLAAFRNRLYARMEEISFRTCITVLTGVTAVAAVIAGASLLMSQSPAPGRPTALSPAPASPPARASYSAAPAPSAPASATPSPPSRAPTSAAPARTPAPVERSPAREATYPATAENYLPVRTAPAAALRTAPVRRSVGSGVAAWLAWWQQIPRVIMVAAWASGTAACAGAVADLRPAADPGPPLILARR